MKRILLFLPLLLLFITGTVMGYYVYHTQLANNRDQSHTDIPSEVMASPTLAPTAKPATPSAENIWTIYNYPEAGYSIEYGNDWLVQTQNASQSATQDYATFEVQSPDYMMDPESIYPILKTGVSISVFTKENQASSSAQEIFDNSLAAEISTNETELTVAGVDAIQYDYSYEGTLATHTILVNQGKEYTIKYRYPNEEVRMMYQKSYQQALRSFRLDLDNETKIN